MRCAPDADMGTISTLSRRELEVYLQLPDDLRNRWLEAGADVEELEGLAEEHFSQVTGPISAAGLAEFAEPIITLFGQVFALLGKTRHLVGLPPAAAEGPALPPRRRQAEVAGRHP